ncbi:hypothetical protein ACOME3_005085 [Neoechinorhynchus agilis]
MNTVMAEKAPSTNSSQSNLLKLRRLFNDYKSDSSTLQVVTDRQHNSLCHLSEWLCSYEGNQSPLYGHLKLIGRLYKIADTASTAQPTSVREFVQILKYYEFVTALVAPALMSQSPDVFAKMTSSVKVIIMRAVEVLESREMNRKKYKSIRCIKLSIPTFITSTTCYRQLRWQLKFTQFLKELDFSLNQFIEVIETTFAQASSLFCKYLGSVTDCLKHSDYWLIVLQISKGAKRFLHAAQKPMQLLTGAEMLIRYPDDESDVTPFMSKRLVSSIREQSNREPGTYTHSLYKAVQSATLVDSNTERQMQVVKAGSAVKATEVIICCATLVFEDTNMLGSNRWISRIQEHVNECTQIVQRYASSPVAYRELCGFNYLSRLSVQINEIVKILRENHSNLRLDLSPHDFVARLRKDFPRFVQILLKALKKDNDYIVPIPFEKILDGVVETVLSNSQ